jgi:hypothetical protein
MTETNLTDYAHTLGSKAKVASTLMARAQAASKVVAIQTRF